MRMLTALRSGNVGWIAAAITLGLLMCGESLAQLTITEVLADSVDDDAWEFVEVHNSGDTPIDLNGYVVDDQDGSALTSANITAEMSGTTVIPAGGYGVLYDGSALEFNAQRFRDAWQLSESIPLIGVANASGINNGGDEIGIWPSFETYLMDVDGIGQTVISFNNTSARIDFNDGFQLGSEKSIYWNMNGDVADGANWMVSEVGVANAVTSVATFLESAQINSTEDIANPGVVPEGPAADGLLITEVLFNPRTDDDATEFVEIYNNTGATIDFSITPHVLDDVGGNAFDDFNITSGSIANGEIAVLFSDDLTIQNMKDAWGEDVNFIPVSSFSALNNGGDKFAIWSNFESYQADKADPNDNFLDPVVQLEYFGGDFDWPVDDGNGSVYLTDLSAEADDGANWALAMPDDGISFNAMPAFENSVPDHPGGDVASPGVGPGEIIGMLDGDFNKDGRLDEIDINLLTDEVVAATNNPDFDLNSDNNVDQMDRRVWVETLKKSVFGDSNLDLEFSSTDFVRVFQAGEYEDAEAGNSGWEEGDWNGDKDFNTSDFVFAFQEGHYEQGPVMAANAVPEPSMVLIPLLVGILVIRRSRIR